MILKAGTYRFNDVLTPIDISSNSEYFLDFICQEYVCKSMVLDISYSAIEPFELSHFFLTFYLFDNDFGVTVYDYSVDSVDNGWKVYPELGVTSILNTITLVTDQTVDYNFGTWFISNTNYNEVNGSTEVTFATLKTKIQSLIDKSNAKTGKTDIDLTTAVDGLIESYGTGGECSGEHVIEVDTLPETGEDGAIYKTPSEFKAICAVEDGNVIEDYFAYMSALYEQYGLGTITATYYTVDSRPTENIQVSTDTDYHLYYIVDEQEVSIYALNSETSEYEWNDMGITGTVPSASEATVEGMYAIAGGGYYQYDEGFKELLIPSGSVEITKEGTHNVTRCASISVNIEKIIKVKTLPTSDIQTDIIYMIPCEGLYQYVNGVWVQYTVDDSTAFLISGAWTFNDDDLYINGNRKDFTGLNFTSNGTTFHTIRLYSGSYPNSMTYIHDTGWMDVYYKDGNWNPNWNLGEEYKIIDFGSTPQTISAECAAFITAVTTTENGTLAVTERAKNTLTITENKTVDVSEYDEVVVDVSTPECTEPHVIAVDTLPMENIDTTAVYECGGKLHKYSDGIIGTWVLNETLTAPDELSTIKTECSFISNDTEYTNFSGYSSSSVPVYAFQYVNTSTNSSRLIYNFSTNTWNWGYDTDKTLEILTIPNNEAFITWLKANATYQGVTGWVEYIAPSGTLDININNTTTEIDVSQYEKVTVNTAEPLQISDSTVLDTITDTPHGVGGNVFLYVGETTDTYENGAYYLLEDTEK